MDLTTLTDMLGGLEGLANGAANAYAESSEANFVAGQFKFNQQISAIQAQEAQQQGVIEQQISQERTTQLSGQQITSEAAQGVDVHGGTAVITRQQTGEIGGLDYLTIGNNAFLKGLGYQIQGENEAAKSALTLEAGKNKASQSLLGGLETLGQDTMKAISYDQQANPGLF